MWQREPAAGGDRGLRIRRPDGHGSRGRYRCGYGYGHRSYGYRSYGYRSYGYRSCYRPYNCYRTFNYGYRPVTYSYCAPAYSSYTPIYRSYWGCW